MSLIALETYSLWALELMTRHSKARQSKARLETGGSLSNFLASSKLKKGSNVLDRVSLILQLSQCVAEKHEVDDVVHMVTSNPLTHWFPSKACWDYLILERQGFVIPGSSSLADSALIQTATVHGTPICLSAPEMLTDKIRPSRKTDVQALGFACQLGDIVLWSQDTARRDLHIRGDNEKKQQWYLFFDI